MTDHSPLPGTLRSKQREVTEDWEKMEAYREKMGIHIH